LHTRTERETGAQIHTHIHAHAHTYAFTNTHTISLTHTHTHTHAHTCTCTHTHVATCDHMQLNTGYTKVCSGAERWGAGVETQKMYGERLGDGVEYHSMKPTPRR